MIISFSILFFNRVQMYPKISIVTRNAKSSEALVLFLKLGLHFAYKSGDKRSQFDGLAIKRLMLLRWIIGYFMVAVSSISAKTIAVITSFAG